jgi:hypothetical protein
MLRVQSVVAGVCTRHSLPLEKLGHHCRGVGMIILRRLLSVTKRPSASWLVTITSKNRMGT